MRINVCCTFFWVAWQMFNDIGTTDNRFGMLVTDSKTGRPCKYGAVMEVSSME